MAQVEEVIAGFTPVEGVSYSRARAQREGRRAPRRAHPPALAAARRPAHHGAACATSFVQRNTAKSQRRRDRRPARARSPGPWSGGSPTRWSRSTPPGARTGSARSPWSSAWRCFDLQFAAWRSAGVEPTHHLDRRPDELEHPARGRGDRSVACVERFPAGHDVPPAPARRPRQRMASAYVALRALDARAHPGPRHHHRRHGRLPVLRRRPRHRDDPDRGPRRPPARGGPRDRHRPGRADRGGPRGRGGRRPRALRARQQGRPAPARRRSSTRWTCRSSRPSTRPSTSASSAETRRPAAPYADSRITSTARDDPVEAMAGRSSCCARERLRTPSTVNTRRNPCPTATRGSLAGLQRHRRPASVAGPLAGQILGDLGAEVIKVERVSPATTPVSGPRRRGTASRSFLHLNRNKLSLELDYKDREEAGAARPDRLRADVLVPEPAAGRPGQAGFSWEELQEINPRLVYCDMTGFGRTGPKAAEGVRPAAAGLHRHHRHDGDGRWTAGRVPLSILDKGTAMSRDRCARRAAHRRADRPGRARRRLAAGDRGDLDPRQRDGRAGRQRKAEEPRLRPRRWCRTAPSRPATAGPSSRPGNQAPGPASARRPAPTRC